MERFVRDLLKQLPPLEEVEAEAGSNYSVLAGRLCSLYFNARFGLEQVAREDAARATLTDSPIPYALAADVPPEEDDEDGEDSEFDHGDPVASVDPEAVQLGALPCITTDATRHDWPELTTR